MSSSQKKRLIPLAEHLVLLEGALELFVQEARRSGAGDAEDEGTRTDNVTQINRLPEVNYAINGRTLSLIH